MRGRCFSARGTASRPTFARELAGGPHYSVAKEYNHMNLFARSLVLAAAVSVIGLTTFAQAPAAPAKVIPVKAEPDVATLLKQVLDNQRALDAKVADIQKRLDSMSQFLGDQRASTFDTVDRRLRDIQDDIKRLSR
jgi:hypothetical protein